MKALSATALVFVITSYGSAAPTPENVAVSSSPFHDCLETGKSWAACRQESVGWANKRAISTSPFHDCLDEGHDWHACKANMSSLFNTQTNDQGSTINKRGWIPDGTKDDDGKTWGGAIKCYSIDKLGPVGWLTNDSVRKLSGQACQKALEGAATAGLGSFKTAIEGFHQGKLGPVVQSKVNFYLSALLHKDVKINLNTVGEDLCLAAIDHLVNEKGCSSARKVGAITSQTSVNGGEFEWTTDGKPPRFETEDDKMTCKNCVLEFVLEAADKVNEDGEIREAGEEQED